MGDDGTLFCDNLQGMLTLTTISDSFSNLIIYYREQGKILGGTKGNAVLEFISGAPVKEFIIEDIPNVFDYDQLTKYGYSVSYCFSDGFPYMNAQA